MAFQSEMRRARQAARIAGCRPTLGKDLRGIFPVSTSGILCRERGQEIGRPRPARPRSRLRDGAHHALIAIGSCSGNRNPSNRHDAETKELAGLRQLGRNAPRVQNGRVLIGVLASESVWRGAVFVAAGTRVIVRCRPLGMRDSVA
jgi:hypothetical protein